MLILLPLRPDSGTPEHGSGAGPDGPAGRGGRGVPPLLPARRVRTEGPENSRVHQDLRALQPGQTVRRRWPLRASHRRVPGGRGEDAATLPAPGQWE